MAETAVVLDAEGKPIVPVVPPVPPVVEKPKAPVYDDVQQAHFDKTINEAYGKAFEKASGLFAPQIQALNDKLAALEKAPPVTPPVVKKEEEVVPPVVGQSQKVTDELARLNALVAETKAIAEENKRLKDESDKKLAATTNQGRENRIKEEFFKAADKHDFFDRSDIFNLVKSDFEIDPTSNEVVVIHPGTKLPRQNSSLKNMSIEEFISDFAKTKPHMVRSTNVDGGTGATGAKKQETTSKDAVPDYAGMPTKDFLGLAQKVISEGYKR